MRDISLRHIWILSVLCGFLYFAGNSSLSLTDPDEVFYSLTAREMSAKGDALTPTIFDQPQFEKPVLIYWLLNIASAFFGPTPFAARFFPAVFAGLGVLGLYFLACLGFKDEQRAFWSAVALATAGFYFALAKTVFTDMVFSVFILYSLLFFYYAFDQPGRIREGILGFYFFAALAALTKGPLGLLIPGLAATLFLTYRGQLHWLRDRRVMTGFLLCLALVLPWYVFMAAQYGNAFIHEFFINDHWRRLIEAEHKGNDRWFFYPATILGGMFPWTFFVAAGFSGIYRRLKDRPGVFDHFLLSWFLVVFVIFQCAHSKLSSYILPVFPVLALLAGDVIGRQRGIRVMLLVMAGLFALLGMAFLACRHLYQPYVPSPLPGYFLSALFITWGGCIATLVLKEKLKRALSVLALIGVPFLIALFLLRYDIEPYVSSYSAAQYLPREGVYKTTILSSKPWARGLRFYTGQDIAVMDINGSNYFSPHPIPILNTLDKVKGFLREQKRTYAVLKKGAYNTLSTLDPAHFKVALLGRCGLEYVLTVEYLGNS
ncbi:MAG: glycosyltransferase family 39 protein [Candidatus Omnitrophica bacterium]|nr:glycosyltransferase family 39 protein [Candidatus Omnitrophota bacterium]